MSGVVSERDEKGRDYEHLTKIRYGGFPEKVGSKYGGRVAHLDSVLFFLHVRAVLLGSWRHSLEGRGHRASLSFLSEMRTLSLAFDLQGAAR